MIVIADTSPINYLVRIGSVDLLPQLFGRVLVPPSVWGELRHPHTPEPVTGDARPADPGRGGMTHGNV